MVRCSPQFRPLVWFLVSAIVWSACALLAGRAASSPAPWEEPSPAWTYQCDSQVVDMIGVGMTQQHSRTITIPDSSWSYLQVGGKGFREEPPRSTTLTFADADSVVLNAPTAVVPAQPPRTAPGARAALRRAVGTAPTARLGISRQRVHVLAQDGKLEQERRETSWPTPTPRAAARSKDSPSGT